MKVLAVGAVGLAAMAAITVFALALTVGATGITAISEQVCPEEDGRITSIVDSFNTENPWAWRSGTLGIARQAEFSFENWEFGGMWESAGEMALALRESSFLLDGSKEASFLGASSGLLSSWMSISANARNVFEGANLNLFGSDGGRLGTAPMNLFDTTLDLDAPRFQSTEEMMAAFSRAILRMPNAPDGPADDADDEDS